VSPAFRWHALAGVVAMALLLCAWPGPAIAGGAPTDARRTALVIGNAHYADMPLQTPVTDARKIAATLRELGFEVSLVENADWATMIDALALFTLRTRDSAVRFFYYAGHGIQVRGRNYLNPVGTAPASEHDLRAASIDLDELIDQLGRLSWGVSVVVVDACRDNPFTRLRRRTRGERAGLASATAAIGTVVAFSASPGGTARDRIDNDLLSPYTRRLLEELRVPGVPIERMFKRVHAAVVRDTGRMQQPWLSTNLTGDFCLRPHEGGGCGD
jgi:uncharacterized caspase-like protein